MNDKPDSLDAILQRLPAGIPLLLPDELLAILFPPGVRGGMLDQQSQIAAETFAIRFNCKFEYVSGEQVGRFTKLPNSN